ncbi:MAG TPA: HAMP domain-containing sensor histidine kinase [Gammaproteobacteria bacterium]|nr:HAMP domain-containing sensor histidine kinase [Gammaproteobacteria bacterium]
MTIFSGELRRTTAFRLTLTYAGVYALLTAIILAIVYGATTSEIGAQMDAGLKAETDALVTLYRAQGIASLRKAVAKRSSPSARHFSDVRDSGTRYYLLVGASDKHLAGDLPAWPEADVSSDSDNASAEWLSYTINARAAVRAGLEKPADFDADDNIEVRGLATALPGGQRLLVVETLDEAEELSDYILYSLLAAIGVILIFGLAGGIWMGRHVVTRLESVRGAATAIMAGDLTRRLPVGSRHDEFDNLALTLNAMLARIEELMNGLRQVTDNVAHDLRSPLNRLRGRLDVTLAQAREPAEYRAAMTRALADADELLQTFNAMLNLAELEAGMSREPRQPIEFHSLCDDVASVYEPLAEDKQLTLNCAIVPARVRGHRRLLAQAVGNLLDNAVKYTPAGGRVDLTLRTEDGNAVLTLADSGPGIPAAEREHVFQRFVRLDRSRSLRGNGLGLSLVRAIVRLHGGRVDLQNNHPGLRATICLPLDTEREPDEKNSLVGNRHRRAAGGRLEGSDEYGTLP